MTGHDEAVESYYAFTSSLEVAEVERRVRQTLQEAVSPAIRDVSSVPVPTGAIIRGRWVLGCVLQWRCAPDANVTAITFEVQPPKVLVPLFWVVAVGIVWGGKHLFSALTIAQLQAVFMGITLAAGATYAVVFKAVERVGLAVKRSVKAPESGLGVGKTVA